MSSTLETRFAALPLTDGGNSTRFVLMHSHRVRYNHSIDAWLIWNGQIWRVDETRQVHELAREVVGTMYEVAAATPDEDQRKRLAKHALDSDSQGRREAMIRGASSNQSIGTTNDMLDTYPGQLNTPSGTVDLTTGEVKEHDRDELQSRITRCAVGPEGSCPLWETFMEWFQPDPEVREWVQRLVGYSVHGSIGENVFPFFHGSGGNGKNVFMDTIRHVLGNYAVSSGGSLLEYRRERGHSTELATLEGYRLVTASEVEEGQRMSTANIKKITGDEHITARRLYQDDREFRNVTSLWLAANDKPRVGSMDDAIWRRLRLIECASQITDEMKDPKLTDKLKAEGEGILAWIIVGARAYNANGLKPPAAVIASTNEYRAESNPLLQWAEAECHVGNMNNWTSTADLRQSYADWARRCRAASVTDKAMADGLARLGAKLRKKGGVRGWDGIVLTSDGTTDWGPGPPV